MRRGTLVLVYGLVTMGVAMACSASFARDQGRQRNNRRVPPTTSLGKAGGNVTFEGRIVSFDKAKRELVVDGSEKNGGGDAKGKNARKFYVAISCLIHGGLTPGGSLDDDLPAGTNVVITYTQSSTTYTANCIEIQAGGSKGEARGGKKKGK
jgi:hypothetical protein